MGLPQTVQAQRDFSAGQVDSTIKRDEDNPLFKIGLRQCSNFRILDTKKLSNRFGRSVKFIDGPRVDEVLMSPGNVFRLVFGNGALSVRNAAGTVVFTTTKKGDNSTTLPWTTATVRNIVWDVYQLSIYITYGDDAPNNVPQVLTWDGVSQSSTWTLSTYAELVNGSQKRTPFYRISPVNVTLQPSATSGAGVTMTASSAVFTPSHVGTRLRWVGRQVLITGYTSATQVTVTIEEVLNTSVILSTFSDPRAQFSIGDVAIGQTSGAKGIVTSMTVNTMTLVLLTGVLFVSGTPNETVVGPAGQVGEQGSSFTTTTPQAVSIWDDEVMNTYRGYPTSVTVDQGRLIFSNFPAVPSGIAWSAIGSLTDLYVPPQGLVADNAIFEIAPGKSQVRYIVAGMQSSEFVFCDNAVYAIPINAANPLSATTGVAFDKIADDGCAAVQPRRMQNIVIYINDGLTTVRAIMTIGAYNRTNESRDISEQHNSLFNAPIAIACPNADASFPERYFYVLNGDGTVVVGKIDVEDGQIRANSLPGWTPWSGNGSIAWISARGSNVWFTTTYTPTVTVAELLDATQYLDAALSYNSVPAAMTPPGGKGPLWWIPGGTCDVMDGLRPMGNYQIDANGFLVPQNFGGENLASSTLVVGQAWTATAEPFIPAPGPGQDVKQRMVRRKIARVAAYVKNSTGYLMARLFAGPLTRTSPALGAIVNERRIAAYNQDDDATKPPPLREGAEFWRPSGRSYDPRVAIIKDTPGPIELLEFGCEVTV